MTRWQCPKCGQTVTVYVKVEGRPVCAGRPTRHRRAVLCVPVAAAYIGKAVNRG